MFDLATNVFLGIADLAWLLAVTRTGTTRGWTAAIGTVAAFAVVSLALATTGDAFAAMRALAWFLFVHAPLVLSVVAIRVGRDWPTRLTAAALAIGLVAVGVDAFLVEPRALTVRHVEVSSPEVDARIRIVVLSDIQTDRVGAYERDAFVRAMALEPELILLPGDFVQVETPRYDEQVAAFRALLPLLHAPLGVWAVKGNVERRSWDEDLFTGTEVHAFRDTRTEDLGLLTLSALSFGDGFDPTLALPGAEGFHVAFAHGPDFSLSAHVGADLLIAGHTHGGQVQLPLVGPLLTMSQVDNTTASGVPRQLGPERWIVVSRGIGHERGYAPRLRFLCRPEILVVDVVPRERAVSH